MVLSCRGRSQSHGGTPLWFAWLVGALCWIHATAALAQGPLPAPGDALNGSNSPKTVVTHGHTLNMVFQSGGKVFFTRSVGGAPWEAPVLASGTLPNTSQATIGASSTGDLAVAFLSRPGIHDFFADAYYTWRKPDQSWTTPALMDQSGGTFATDLAMTVFRDRVHLVVTSLAVAYFTFPLSDPTQISIEHFDERPICCSSVETNTPSIAVTSDPRTKAEVVFVAYGFFLDATGNSCVCHEHDLESGAVVARRLGPGNWQLRDFSDLRTLKQRPPAFIAAPYSVSLAATPGGDFFLAYSDEFCIVNGFDCLSPNRDPFFRTKLARYDAQTLRWTSLLIGDGLAGVSVAGSDVPAPGANFNLARKGSFCSNSLYDWHGTASFPTPRMEFDLGHCASGPEALFFTQACTNSCLGISSLWVDPVTASIRTFRDCDPVVLPNLAIDQLAVSPSSLYPGGQLALQYRVRNLGDTSALPTAAWVSLVAPNGTESRIGIKSISALPAHSSRLVSQTLDLPELATGSYRLAVTVDGASRICEGDEIDNRFELSGLGIASPPPCTFTGCQIRVGPSTVPIDPSPTLFIADAGPQSCARSGTATYTWYRRQTVGTGPWGSPVQSGVANSLLVGPSVSSYEIRVDANDDPLSCTATFAFGTPIDNP